MESILDALSKVSSRSDLGLSIVSKKDLNIFAYQKPQTFLSTTNLQYSAI